MIKNLAKSILKKPFLTNNKTQLVKSSFSTINKAQQNHQNKLKFVFLGGTVGGGMVGYCLGYLITGNDDKDDDDDEDEKKNENKKEQTDSKVIDYFPSDKNNFLNFTGKWNYNWDGLQQKYDEIQKENEDNKDKKDYKQKKLGTRYITLIRHGQYHTEEEEADKKVLTKLGEQQAHATGKRLKTLDRKYNKIYVSDMIRSQQTGNIIAKYLSKSERIEDPLLAEGFPCPISPGESRNNKYNPEGSGKRISDGFEKYFKRCETEEDSHELMVIHSNVIRYFFCRALQYPVEGWLRMSVAHCGITRISISPRGTVHVEELGNAGHLQKDQVTTA